MSRLANAIEAILAVLDQMELPYAIGGSIASSVYGLSRATMDVDIVVDLDVEGVPELARLTKSQFYLDEQDACNAILRGRSFNLVHLETLYKVDIFPATRDAFRQTELARRIFGEFPFEGKTLECAVTSAEDTVLAKLGWFRMSGSARQWDDLLGILTVCGDRLDRAYLDEWANKLNVSDLLTRLFASSD